MQSGLVGGGGLRLPKSWFDLAGYRGRMLLFFFGQNHAEEWRKNGKRHGISFFGRLMIPSWFSRWTCYLKIIFLDQFSTEPEPYQQGWMMISWTTDPAPPNKDFPRTGGSERETFTSQQGQRRCQLNMMLHMKESGGKVARWKVVISNLQIPNSEISHSFILERNRSTFTR